MRVVAYNVRGFRDGADRVARVVGDLAPDVLLLNETGARRRLRRFARSLGMAVAADPWSPLRRRAKDAVLVRPPWRIEQHHQQRFAGSARFYPRAALVARLRRDGLGLWAIAIHLGLRPLERLQHAEELLRSIARLDGPVVLGGDLNERPEGKAVARLGRVLPDAWSLAGEGPAETIPASAPTARIDFLFVSPTIAVERAFVPQDAAIAVASDHRPVVVDLSLAEPERDPAVAAGP